MKAKRLSDNQIECLRMLRAESMLIRHAGPMSASTVRSLQDRGLVTVSTVRSTAWLTGTGVAFVEGEAILNEVLEVYGMTSETPPAKMQGKRVFDAAGTDLGVLTASSVWSMLDDAGLYPLDL